MTGQEEEDILPSKKDVQPTNVTEGEIKVVIGSQIEF